MERKRKAPIMEAVIKSENKDNDKSNYNQENLSKEPQIISGIIDKVKDDPESLFRYIKKGGKK